MRNIKFTHTGHAHAIGNFEAGDVARNLPDDVAHHFVEEARCAVYDDAPETEAKHKAPKAQKAPKAVKGTEA